MAGGEIGWGWNILENLGRTATFWKVHWNCENLLGYCTSNLRVGIMTWPRKIWWSTPHCIAHLVYSRGGHENCLCISTCPPVIIVDNCLRYLISKLYKLKFPKTINSQTARSIANCILHVCSVLYIVTDRSIQSQAVYTYKHMIQSFTVLWWQNTSCALSLSSFVYLPVVQLNIEYAPKWYTAPCSPWWPFPFIFYCSF